MNWGRAQRHRETVIDVCKEADDPVVMMRDRDEILILMLELEGFEHRVDPDCPPGKWYVLDRGYVEEVMRSSSPLPVVRPSSNGADPTRRRRRRLRDRLARAWRRRRVR